MGLNALKCDGYADSAEIGRSEGRLAASDFSGKDIIGYAAVMAAITAVSGCISSYQSETGKSSVGETQTHDQPSAGEDSGKDKTPLPATTTPKPMQPQENYPFDPHEKPKTFMGYGSPRGDITAMWFNDSVKVRGGLHSNTTDITYWVELKDLKSNEDGTKLASYNVYCQGPSGLIEKSEIRLDMQKLGFVDDRPLSEEIEDYEKNIRDEIQNPDLRDKVAVVNCAGSKPNYMVVMRGLGQQTPGIMITQGTISEFVKK